MCLKQINESEFKVLPVTSKQRTTKCLKLGDHTYSAPQFVGVEVVAVIICVFQAFSAVNDDTVI